MNEKGRGSVTEQSERPTEERDASRDTVNPAAGAADRDSPPTDGNRSRTAKKRRFTHDPAMFWVNFATFWVAFATFIAVVVYASFAHRQADAARRTVKLLREQFESTERPWVYADVAINDPPIWSRDSLSIPLRYVVKNVGKSPAAHVWVFATIAKSSNLISNRRSNVNRCGGILLTMPGNRASHYFLDKWSPLSLRRSRQISTR
jgi:hypothetical protein